jgi:hypothetical protein
MSGLLARCRYLLASLGVPPSTRPTSSDRVFYLALAELVRRYETPDAPVRSAATTLTGHELRVCSQNGEDGVLAELLRRVGIRSRWFVEFGIDRGVEGNCVFLAQVLGWSGAFFECDAHNHDLLDRLYSGNPRVGTVRAAVTPDNVEALFAEAGVPEQPDVLSIDVDGNDYWIWRAITRYRPRVVVIEYNAHLPFAARLVQPRDDTRGSDGTDNFGASLGALQSLGEQKGYRLVHTELTGTNAFFVRADLAGDFTGEVPQRAANFYLHGVGHDPHPDPAPAYVDLDASSDADVAR